MKLLYLMSKKTVTLDDNARVTLNYCLVEEQEYRNKPLYGIKLIQENTLQQATSEYTEPLSYSKSYVMNILNQLINHDILPSNLNEVVDDLVS